MPIVNVTWTGRQDRNVKNDFYDFTAGLINRETGTDPNLIYVFIREIGIEGDYEGIGHLVLGYAAESSAETSSEPAPRKKDYVYRV
jgi:phenylpyruvate tautomerase PptA (4-oxalocrotonate tautomerase family)